MIQHARTPAPAYTGGAVDLAFAKVTSSSFTPNSSSARPHPGTSSGKLVRRQEDFENLPVFTHYGGWSAPEVFQGQLPRLS